ncbi:MAG: hypothetical protein L0Y64_18310, partial [Myxococcaceae bacterium]|nr:hypothetical protein [Myxococcaceae bacterium]
MGAYPPRFMELVADLDRLDALLRPVVERAVPCYAFDTETTEVKDERFTPYGTDTRMAGFSISYGKDVDFYVPVRHRSYPWTRRRDLLAQAEGGARWLALLDAEPEPANLPVAAVMERLESTFRSGLPAFGHNWPFDAKMVLVDGLEPPWESWEDVYLLSMFTDERQVDAWDDAKETWAHGGHALKHLGAVYLGRKPDEEDLLKECRKALQCDDYSLLPLRGVLAPYACQDTRLTLNLGLLMKRRAAWQDEAARELYYMHLREYRHVLGMEQRGVHVDQALVKHEAEEATKRLQAARLKANEAAGKLLPLGNPEQLSKVLYNPAEGIGLPLYRGKNDTRKATLK